MIFKNKFSTKQTSSIFFIIMGFILFSVEFEEAYRIVKLIAVFMIIFSVLQFWKEAARRYKILVPYKKNNYDSKAEEKIAEYFKRKNIIFHHHPEIKVSKQFWIFTIPFVNIKLEPDFFLPEFEVFVEYWDMIDNPDYKRNEYDRKKKLYINNEIDFISLYPKNMNNLDFIFTIKFLDLIKEREGNLRRYR